MIVVVPVDPPRSGLVLSSLADSTPLTESEAAALYEAAVTDVLRAAEQSGGEVLLNYRDEETLPDEFVDASDASGDTSPDAELEIRELAGNALESVDADEEASGSNGPNGSDDADTIRVERQVGSTYSARIGNTVTHLLTQEDAGTVGILDPTAPLVGRTEIDGAAMSLRRHDVVLGPSSRGRAYFAGFTEPIDFTEAYEPPALSTLARRTTAAEPDLQLGFAPMLPTVATESGLCSTIATLEARQQAGRPGAATTARVVSELGLSVGSGETLERTETDNPF